MKKAKQYAKAFRNKWSNESQFKIWLMPVIGDDTKAYCKFCKSTIKEKYQDLKLHCETRKHKTYIPTQINTLDCFKVKCNDSSQIEAAIAMFVTSHCAIKNCDHFVDLRKSIIKDSKCLNDVQMHRTKCTNIIKNILCDHFEKDLRDDIGAGKFSLLLDESNDIAASKLLGLSIIYHSIQQSKVISTNLGQVELDQCDAEAIVNALKLLLAKMKLNLQNLLAIGTDNASVVVRVNNGVYAKLKVKLSHLILIKCLCHPLQLAVSQASRETLTKELEFLIAETNRWFSHSFRRQQLYKQLYQTINDGANPLKIPKNCATRWFSIHHAVERVVQQWLEIKNSF